MRCLSCGKEALLGVLVIKKTLPMAHKGGSINVAGEKVTQADMKKIWDKDVSGDDDRIIRGPIICGECEAHHYYVKGASPALRLGNYTDACSKGLDALLADEGDGDDGDEEE